jgi:hypothetical protein
VLLLIILLVKSLTINSKTFWASSNIRALYASISGCDAAYCPPLYRQVLLSES